MKKFAEDVLEAHLKGLSGFNSRGEEIPNPVPAEMPIGFGHPRSLQDDIRAMISNEVQSELSERGIETFEDANDFQTGEDGEFFSPHEDDVDPHHTLARESEMRSGRVEQPNFEENKKNLDSLYEDYNKQKSQKRARKNKVEREPESGEMEEETPAEK